LSLRLLLVALLALPAAAHAASRVQAAPCRKRLGRMREQVSMGAGI
jgi:hypothetical protein